MLFPTVQFAVFFPPVFALSWLLMSRPKLWKPFIVAASYLFYAAADWRFCFLIAPSPSATRPPRCSSHRSENERTRKWIVAAAVTLDLAVLGLFKYYGFFVTDINDALRVVSLDAAASADEHRIADRRVVLYVPSNLVTWSTCSAGCWSRRARSTSRSTSASSPTSSPARSCAPASSCPSSQTPRDPRNIALGAACWLIALGLIKKVGIADYLAREVVDPVFAVPGAFARADAWLALYAYAAQIYCDFSGYTDMAIGIALLMGFTFPQNFDRPYRSTSFQEFWRRWHMTLSRFIRDFIFIPLGGSRGGRLKTARNLMITMLLGGLWHGAAWTFVLWGAFHGAAQVVERELRGRVRAPGWLCWLLVFHLVCLSWILFRASDLEHARGPSSSGSSRPARRRLSPCPRCSRSSTVIGLHLLPERPLERIRERFEDFPPPVLAAGVLAVILCVAATVPSQGVPPFIYFQF